MVKGVNTTFAILESNQILAWGSSKNGKLGFPMANGKNYRIPKEIIAVNNFPRPIISCRPFHCPVSTAVAAAAVLFWTAFGN